MKKNTIMKMAATVTTGILGLSMIGCGQKTGDVNVAEETKKVVRTFFNEYQDYKTFGDMSFTFERDSEQSMYKELTYKKTADGEEITENVKVEEIISDLSFTFSVKRIDGTVWLDMEYTETEKRTNVLLLAETLLLETREEVVTTVTNVESGKIGEEYFIRKSVSRTKDKGEPVETKLYQRYDQASYESIIDYFLGGVLDDYFLDAYNMWGMSSVLSKAMDAKITKEKDTIKLSAEMATYNVYDLEISGQYMKMKSELGKNGLKSISVDMVVEEGNRQKQDATQTLKINYASDIQEITNAYEGYEEGSVDIYDIPDFELEFIG